MHPDLFLYFDKPCPTYSHHQRSGVNLITSFPPNRLTENLKEMDRQVNELEKQIQLWHRGNEASRKLEAIPGLGPITASAIVATVGDAREFRNGRQLAAGMAGVSAAAELQRGQADSIGNQQSCGPC